MKHGAFLIGISRYSDYTLEGVPNDVALVASALHKHYYPADAIHCFIDSRATLTGLHQLLAHIQVDYAAVEQRTCLLYITGSGALSYELLRGGVQPSDGCLDDFRTALAFDALNAYLPVRPGLQVTVIIDT